MEVPINPTTQTQKKPLVNVGKISYTIYVYHSFVACKVPEVFHQKFNLS